MAIFHSYVSSPEGKFTNLRHPGFLHLAPAEDGRSRGQGLVEYSTAEEARRNDMLCPPRRGSKCHARTMVVD